MTRSICEDLRTVEPRHDGIELLLVACCRKAATLIETQAALLEECERRIRILVWNREKAEGNSDRGAMQVVEEEIATLAKLKERRDG